MSTRAIKSGRTATGRTVGSCGECGTGIATDGATADTVTTCPECGARVRLRLVFGEHSDIPCDGRCMGAIGPVCSCACGGANHGGWNLRVELVPVWDRDNARAAQDRRRGEHAARRQTVADRQAAARDDLVAEYPELGDLLTDRYADAGGFFWDMRAALRRGEMTPAQVAAAVRAVRRDRERDAREAEREAADALALAAGVEVPAGKVTFTGTVVAVKFQASDDPRWSGSHKMLLEHADGWRAWGSVPAELRTYEQAAYSSDDVERWRQDMRGRVLTITATVAPSKDDPLFGYFTRPRLVAVEAGEVARPVVADVPAVAAPRVFEVAPPAGPSLPAVVSAPRREWPGQMALFG